jgi:DNA-directed RNA polymerase subunit beta
LKFIRSNTSTSINQHPIVKKGQEIKAGDPLADGASIDKGELGPRSEHARGVYVLGRRQL